MLNRLYGWYGKGVVRGVLGILVLLILVGGFFYAQKMRGSVLTETEEKLQGVTLQSVRDVSRESGFSVVGTVRAVSEAKLQAEASGRVTAVNVAIGDTVVAGEILATIENSIERAALLQAEGAYESALTSSKQDTASLDETRITVRNTYRDAFSTADDVVRNLIDDFYSNPTESIIGFRLDSNGGTQEFNNARKDSEVTLDTWASHVTNNFQGLSEPQMLTFAEESVTKISNLASSLALVIADEESDGAFTESELVAYASRLASARENLNGTLSTISATRRSYDQAVLDASSDVASQSDASLKSALGSLRAAQARYEKTIVRSPISGVVNALYLKTGEYVQMGEQAAIVANNGSLEIQTALGEEDVAHVKTGDTVLINNTLSGTVTHVAPAVDPTTGKSEVKISVATTDVIKNGSTVSVEFSRNTEETATLSVPLKALKLLASESIAFGVDENNTLIAYPVTLGKIFGDSVEIVTGLTPESRIVTDARGLTSGQKVRVIQE